MLCCMFAATNMLRNIRSSQIYKEMEHLSFLKTELKLKRRLLTICGFNFRAQMFFSSLAALLYLNHVQRNILIKHCFSKLETK